MPTRGHDTLWVPDASRTISASRMSTEGTDALGTAATALACTGGTSEGVAPLPMEMKTSSPSPMVFVSMRVSSILAPERSDTTTEGHKEDEGEVDP